MKIEQMPISALYEYGNNSRTHSDAQIDQIIASINEFGFTNPVLINKDGMIIAGHGRFQAAVKMKLAKVPCIRLTHLSERQQRAYVIADNKIALNSGWDFAKLSAEADALAMLDFDTDLLGFDEQELDALLKNDFDLFAGGEVNVSGYTRRKHADIEEDEAPEEPQEVLVKSGDLYQLGRHRLFCSNPFLEENVKFLFNGASPELMITMVHEAEEYKENGWSPAFSLFPGVAVYVWHGSLLGADVLNDLNKSDFVANAQILWIKKNPEASRSHYRSQHESCWHAIRKGKKAKWIGEEPMSTVWTIEKQDKLENKKYSRLPVECMARPLKNHAGDVYDPFAGSGSSVIAAEQFDRICYAMEWRPMLCAMIIERWESFTGEKAVYLGNFPKNID
jgi:hypothetical protein